MYFLFRPLSETRYPGLLVAELPVNQTQSGQEMFGRALVVGVGNRMRRDDGIGLAVAAQLENNPPPMTSITSLEGDCFRLLDIWRKSERVYVVDATLGSEPGRIQRVDCSRWQMPSELAGGSTHGFGVWQAVQLARSLGRLPEHLVIVAVTGADFGLGEGLSPPVKRAVPEVVDFLRRELQSAQPPRRAGAID